MVIISANPVISISSSATNEYSPNLSKGENSNYFYLAWTEDNGSGTDKNVKIAKFDSNGISQWSNPANVGGIGKNQYEPGLTFNNNNSNAYVSWTDDREGNEDIYTQKFNTTGNSQWSSDQRININTDSSNQDDSAIIINSAGQALGAWSDQRNGSSSSDVYATKFGDPGTANSVGNVSLNIKGSKIISDPLYPIVLKYNKMQATDASGNLTLGLEFDAYTITSSSTISFTSPTLPISLAPADNKTIQIYVQ